MDIAAFFKEHWAALAAAPLTFFLFALVVSSVVFVLTRIVIGGALEACRERLAGAQDEVARLKGERDELFRRLEAHGEDIKEIKASLAAAPKTYVSTEPPPAGGFGKDGDVWLQVEK